MPDNDNQQNKLENAGEQLFDSVYVPVLLKQCEARGYSISTPEELHSAVQSIVMIKQASANQPDNQNLHKQANMVLRASFGENIEQTEINNSREAQFSNAITAIDVNPEIAKSASVLADANK